MGSIFRSSKHEEKVGVQSLDFKYKHRQEESWLVWFREERQILCVCGGGVESRWKGSEDRSVTGNSLGAGEGNRDDNQVLHRYGVKEKNER